MPNLTCQYGDTKLVAYRDYDFNVRELGKSRKLRCPECGRAMYLKKGKIIIAHFAHFPSKEVYQCSRTNESKEHFECKNYIAQLLESKYSASNVFPEHKLESGQEADVFLELPNLKVAFEIQFSQQDQLKWETRIELYKKHGIASVWILGFKKSLGELKKQYEQFSIAVTMQNAGLEIPDSRNWKRYFALTPFVQENQKGKSHLFHVMTWVDKKIDFYLGYLRREPDTKTLWNGEFLPIVSDWEFLESELRFVPDKEKHFNTEYLKSEKERKEIESIAIEKNGVQQEKLDKAREKRQELRNKLLQWLNVSHEADIPEVQLQYKHHKISLFTIKRGYDDRERLIAEIAIFFKFVKTKPVGFEFSYHKDVEPFLREWGFCWDEIRQSVAAQMSSGFLGRLRTLGILEKSPNNDKWKVIKDTIE